MSPTWKLSDRELSFESGPIAAGIVNVTADSMFEGARSVTPERAIEDGAALAEAGFGMLDVGAIAARAGDPVSSEDEAARLVPAVTGLAARLGAGSGMGGNAGSDGVSGADVPISADTFSGSVARQALAAGASIVNDISGGRDPEIFDAVAESGAGYVLMHIEGPPRVDRDAPDLGDPVAHLKQWFTARIEAARAAGIAPEQIAIDPGLDFDLSVHDNLEILRRLHELHELGRPVYLSLSRKDFIGAVMSGSWETRLEPPEREWGTVAATALAVAAGAQIHRLHDASSLQAMRLAAAVSWKG